MKHALVVYDPATGKEIVSIPLTTEMFWAIAATIEPEEDDHPDMIACYELPLDFFLEPDPDEGADDGAHRLQEHRAGG